MQPKSTARALTAREAAAMSMLVANKVAMSLAVPFDGAADRWVNAKTAMLSARDVYLEG